MLNLSNISHPEYYHQVMNSGLSAGVLAGRWTQQINANLPAIQHLQQIAISTELTDLAMMTAIGFAARIFWAFWDQRPGRRRYRY